MAKARLLYYFPRKESEEIPIKSNNHLVLDDWCEASGRIPKNSLDQISRFGKEAPSHICILLISKGSIDASGNTDEPIIARASEQMDKNGYEIWRLWRAKEGPHRTLDCAGKIHDLKLDDSGIKV